MSGLAQELGKKAETLARTQKIIRVTELSTLSKIGRLLKQAERAVSYQERILQTLQQVQQRLGVQEDAESAMPLIIVVTSNRGFCGAYNSNVFAEFDQMFQQFSVRPQVIVIGKQGYKYMQKQECDILEFIDKPIEDISLEDTAEMTSRLLAGLADNKFDALHFVYTQYIDAVHSTARSIEIYPSLPESKTNVELEGILDFEEDEDEMEAILLENYLCGLIYSMLLYSVASEYSARRIAMKTAKDSIEDELDSTLRLKKKSAMQQSTSELFDIIMSAKVLETEATPSQFTKPKKKNAKEKKR